MYLHATCVDLTGLGVLIVGNPGIGKSTLALALLERGARLVADDQVLLSVEAGTLRATAPPVAKAAIEIAGFGIIRLTDICQQTDVKLVLHLTDEPLERVAQSTLSMDYLGISLSQLNVPAFDPLCGMKAMYYIAAWRDNRLADRLPVASAPDSP